MRVTANSLTEHQKEKIRKIYLKEKSITKTSISSGYGFKVVRTVLRQSNMLNHKKRNIKYRKDFNDSDLDRIESDYKSGKSVALLAKENKTTVDVINGMLGLSKEREKKIVKFKSANEAAIYCALVASSNHKRITSMFKPTLDLFC